MSASVPKVGDQIYVRTSLFIDHGRDDRVGGLATVTAVKGGISAGKTVPFVSVAEHPGVIYNWEFLSEQQEKLSRQFGQNRAHTDPDWHPQSNCA